MASRILRDWTDSERIDSLSYQSEVLFTRLFMKADDYGSFFANPKLIRAQLFPLRLDKVREADISRWVHELHSAGLIALYEADSKQYLRILNFGQRLRTMKKRFPDMPNVGNLRQPAAICGNPRPEDEVETEVETEKKKSTVVDQKDDDSGDGVPDFVKEDQKRVLEVNSNPVRFNVGQFDWDSWREDVSRNTQLLEVIGMKNKLSADRIQELLGEFSKEKQAVGEKPKSDTDAAKWFMFWVPKRLKGEVQVESKGKITQGKETINRAAELVKQRLKQGFYADDPY